MKLLLAITAALALAYLKTHAAETPNPKPETRNQAPYQSGQFTVAGFGSYRAHELGALDGRFGYGAEIGYFLKDNLSLNLEAITENPQHAAIDEAGLNFKGYLPIGKTGFAPYGLLGVSHSFEALTITQVSKTKTGSTTTRVIDDGEWRMNAGAGIEFRASKTFGLFADGRWTHDFDTLGHALFRVGANLSF